MDVGSLLKSLAGGAGGVVAKQIAEALGNGLNIPFLKDKNEEIIAALKTINKKLDDLTYTITDAIRMTKITDARDAIYYTLHWIQTSIQNNDKGEYAKAVEAINGRDGILNHLENMDLALVEHHGASGAAILQEMADKKWARLQDTKDYDYGVMQFEADCVSDPNILFLITVERLGLSLLHVYNNTRKDRTEAQKEQANRQADQESEARVKRWLGVFAAKTGSSTAYKLLSDDIKRQTRTGTPSEPPTPQTPLIRSLVKKGKTSWGENKDGEITLDACLLVLLNTGYPDEVWVPVRRSNPRVEWKFSFNVSTGRWTMTNAMWPKDVQDLASGGPYDCKLVPLPDAEGQTGRPMVFVSVKGDHWRGQMFMGGAVEFRQLPPSVEPSTAMRERLEPWAKESSRWFVARIENHSDYLLIPQTTTRARFALDGTDGIETVFNMSSLNGQDMIYDSPLLPNSSTYVAGRSNGILTGATALFDFAIWKCSGIGGTQSREANETRFHQCKTYGEQGYRQPAQLGMQPEFATRVGAVVFMVSVSYGGGDKRGAMWVNEFGPDEAYQLQDSEVMTGSYHCSSSMSWTLKSVRVDSDLDPTLVGLGQPSTYFKVFNK